MPWLTGNDLLSLKGAGGENFTKFVDSLIRGEAYAGGLPQSEVHNQIRQNIGDGGVDTAVDGPIPSDRSGYFGVPTCWQFKAEETSDLKKRKTNRDPLKFVTDEINKPEVVRRIKLGHGFRFCFLGDLTPADLNTWEQHLLAESRKINVNAAPPRVIAADQLVIWANRFPAALQHFRLFSETVFYLNTWREIARHVTPDYVAHDGWSQVTQAILQHAQAGPTHNSCLLILGEAGIGKTRLVFETLATLPGAASVVIYTRDEQVARNLSVQFANAQDFPCAIVVADECSSDASFEIEENIRHCSDRIRFICISNSQGRIRSAASPLRLEKLPDAVVDNVIKKNFPQVSPERRHAYVRLSGGFIRVAADLCQHGERLAGGNLELMLGHFDNYVVVRLPNPDARKVLHMLALFTRVGAKKDVAGQLTSVCEITGLTPSVVVDIATQIKDSPGFVNVVGRYLYVTPAIIAGTAFAIGWKTWVQDDPKAFIEKLHPSLVEPFLDQVRQLATSNARAVVADIFRDWFLSRQPEDLIDGHQTERLAVLVETDPGQYLILLRELVERCPAEVLRTASQHGRSSRFPTVSICEKLAVFPEFYESCEAILYKLAVNESDVNIGNNSTGIWQQLQRIHLSGCSTPFSERFAVLRKRVTECDASTVDLILKGIFSVLDSDGGRMGGAPTISGRLRPDDWHPEDNSVAVECWKKAFGLLSDMANGDDDAKGQKAVELFLKSFPKFIHRGFLEDSKSILKAKRFTSQNLFSAIEAAESFLAWEERAKGGRQHPVNPKWAEYVEHVRKWIAEVGPTSFEGRLRLMLSHDSWHETVRGDNGEANPQVLALAAEVVAAPPLLSPVISFLMSPDAKSAATFGAALGSLDRNGRFITIFDAITKGSDLSFAQGYLFGSYKDTEAVPKEVDDQIARIGSTDPDAEFNLRATLGDKLGAMAFALRAIDRGDLPVTAVSRFRYTSLPISQVLEILQRFKSARQQQNSAFESTIVDFLFGLWNRGGAKPEDSSIEDASVRDLAWDLLADNSLSGSRGEEYEYAVVMKQLAVYDPLRAARLLFDSMLKQDYLGRHSQSLAHLEELSASYPEAVMDVLFEALRDDSLRRKLTLDEAIAILVRGVPSNVLVACVRAASADIAKLIAANLPLPFVDKDDQAVVPQLTLAYLCELGGEGGVCRSFVEGTLRSDSWWGNGSDHFRAKAAVSSRFLSHKNSCIREWAEKSVRKYERMARDFQDDDDQRLS